MYINKLLKYKIDILTLKFKLLFIKNKKLKVRFKYIETYRATKNFSKKLKWGISYSVFDGEEILESSLESIRKSADYINVVFQKTSWFNEPCSETLIKTLENLKQKGLIDEIIEYKPNYKYSAGKQEKQKRNLGLKYAKNSKCDYFMTMDTDEFYFDNELTKLKLHMCQYGITNSYCAQKMYLNENKLMLNQNLCGVPLFAKINPFSRIKQFKNNIILTDPTRKIHRIFNIKPFVYTNIYMHHYSYLRKDIDKKLRNSSLNYGTMEINKLKTSLHNDKLSIADVENYFNIKVN